MNQQHKQTGLGMPKLGTVQNAPNQAQSVTGYEECQNAVTDRKQVEFVDAENSAMPKQDKG